MTVEERLRRFLLIVTASIFAGTIAELLLLEHYEEPLQLAPFVLSVLGLVVVVAVLVARRRALLQALRIVMLAVALGAIAGIAIHMSNNVEFEREIAPNASTGDVVWRAIHGGSPLLAPGILLLAATLGSAATWRFEPRR